MKLENLINVYEVFNTVVPVEWTHDGQRYVGVFDVDGQAFRLFLEPGYFEAPGLDYTYTFLNVAFSKFENGRDVFDLQDSGPFASKVFGAVKHAIEQKTQTLEKYDAIVFAARDNQQQRMRVYNRLARYWAKDFGSIQENIKATSGTVVTVLMRNASAPGYKEFVDFLVQRGKI